jgi:hypothetical protein
LAKVVKIFQYATNVLFFAVIASVSGLPQNGATETKGSVVWETDEEIGS